MNVVTTGHSPFALDIDIRPSWLKPAWKLARPILERALALKPLTRLYEKARSAGSASFVERALATCEVDYALSDEDLRQLPATGPLLIVANHPFGAIEGLVLLSLLHRVRPDVRIMGNFLLSRVPEMREHLIAVDPFGTPEAGRRNTAPLRAALTWLKSGGALAVFPAGEVAHLDVRRGAVHEPPWSDTIVRLALRTRAAVAPVRFEGRNSWLFQAAGLLHPRLRTALLPHEFLRQRGQTLKVRVGSVIPATRLARFEDARAATEYLRLRTLLLRGSASRSHPRVRSPLIRQVQAPLIAPVPAEELARNVAALLPEDLLVDQGDHAVYCAPAERLDRVLIEIGRLREMAFRRVGEGTGREFDLDAFDRTYLHLFVWNRASREIVGAYRLGPTEDILPRDGVRGLYTHTLFRYSHRLLDQVGPAIELGRSFVAPGHQRSYAPLMLLWKGIGAFVTRHPQYRRLFGAVSISADYDSMTRRILIDFLRHNHYAEEWAALARPRRPPRTPRIAGCDRRTLTTVVRSIDEVDELVREIEADAKGIPVLLRQYLKLNGRLMGFSVDTQFGNVVDGFFVVDLTQVEPNVLRRYLGRAEADAFLRHHASASVADAS